MTRKAAIMFQGTGSDVGKSLIVAGLARAFTRRGLRVRPFKPQNMSNNAAVTADGGEIGRAQALQARAARVPASVHMNPVLLKPQSETGSQIVVQGQVFGQAKAADYHRLKPQLLDKVLESFHRLQAEADLVLVEGAGSPAEINLRADDIANMGFAAAADLPVILIGDIDRGGVIASIVGTKMLLQPDEAARLQGFLINKFRGDIALFTDGVRIIEERAQLPGLGVIPWFAEAGLLPAEDAMALDSYGATASGRRIRIAVPRLPRISNFDDLDPLRAEPDVDLLLLSPGEALPGDLDLVLLPGSKSTIGDLQAFIGAGWDIDLKAHLRRGGSVLGLCGGYQMLGQRLDDPDGSEGPAGSIAGLGLLDVTTRLGGAKTLTEVTGRDHVTGQAIHGYEMHIGVTTGPGCATPMLDLAAKLGQTDASGNGRLDGACTADGKVMGCYVHGLFASDAFRHTFLNRLKARTASGLAYDQLVDDLLDRLADHLAAHVDLDRLWSIAGG